jgi:hypothetical protein
MKLIKYGIVYLFLFCTLLPLTINRHIQRQPFTYKSEIWGDKAGYYIYLPALFEYQFNGETAPKDIVNKTGNGFQIYGNTIVTKYPAGTAIMIAPFWLLNKIIHPNDNPFSNSYHLVINVAATFYLAMGLFISFLCFNNYTTTKNAAIICIFMLLATNLFYYGIDETGMSHIYSFALFSVVLYIGIHLHRITKKYPTLLFITLGILLGLIFLVRHINILFFFPIILISQVDLKECFQTLKILILSSKSILLFSIAAILVTPQIFYYYHVESTVSAAPYSGEGFIYLLSPKILEVLFAPKNGLFLYAPFLLIVLGFIIWKTNLSDFKKPILFIPFLLFGSIVYLYASWWSYELGCALGHRSLVEFLPVLFLPLALIIKEKRISIALIITFFICSCYTLKIMYSYDGCFFSYTDWNWPQYYQLVMSPTK